MRRVVTHPAEARAKGVAARKHLVRNFSPEVVARQLHEQVGYACRGVFMRMDGTCSLTRFSVKKLVTHTRALGDYVLFERKGGGG